MFVTGPIPDSILKRVASSEGDNTGAISVFIGRVRGDNLNGKKVEIIEFTCHKSISEKTAMDIIEESKKRFGILHVEIWHSLGKVRKGQPCFLVKVHSTHRRESFAALPYIVDEIKNRCPVFGKEIFTDGHYKWKENKI